MSYQPSFATKTTEALHWLSHALLFLTLYDIIKVYGNHVEKIKIRQGMTNQKTIPLGKNYMKSLLSHIIADLYTIHSKNVFY